MQNVFLLKENSSKYYLAATSILKVCDSASFKKQNHKTENHVHWDWPPLFQSGHVESTSQGLEKLKCPSSRLSSSDGEDGVVRLAGPTHLHVAEAGLGEHAGVLGRRALAALRLHQHVEGEDLSHDGPPPVLKQHGFHQQDAAAWRDDGQRHKEHWEGVKVFREVDLVRFIFLFCITGGRARTQTHLLSKTHLVRRCRRSSSAASGTSLQASREWFWPERRDRQEGFHRQRNLLNTRQKSSDSFRQRQSRCSYWTNRLMRLFCITVTQKQHKFNVINFIKLFISGWIRGSPVWNATASFSWEKCFWAVSTTCGRSNTVTEEEGYAFAISRARAPVHPGSFSNRTTWKQEFTVFSVKVWNHTEGTFYQLIWETKVYLVSIFDCFHVVKCKQECFPIHKN